MRADPCDGIARPVESPPRERFLAGNGGSADLFAAQHDVQTFALLLGVDAQANDGIDDFQKDEVWNRVEYRDPTQEADSHV